MGTPNLTLRGSTYWWRRRVTVGGHPISLALSLRKVGFNQAKARASLLSAEVEKLRMAYGDRGVAIHPATLKKIFSDALRSLLERIETDQLASADHPDVHLWTNRAMGEMWRIFARPDPRWLAEDDERLAAAGWTIEQRLLVADLWEHNRGQRLISKTQLDAYEEQFGYAPTQANLDRVQRTIYSARAEACDEAERRMTAHPAGMDGWANYALNDQSPFAFEAQPMRRAESAFDTNVPSASAETEDPSANAADQSEAAAKSSRPKTGTLLTEAAERCLRTHIQQDALAKSTMTQVKTAIRLFDYACGGGITIEELAQKHVEAFYDLCRALPNRWGRTKAELAGGLSASLQYAQELRAKGEGHRVGIVPATINKHISHISKVLDFMDDDGSLTGIRPATPLRLKPKNQQIGAKKIAKTVRARDKRANWNREEIARLLEAPPFHGCAGIDDRFVFGAEVIHDAWYWLPLMFILYGGRSAELTGLPMRDVHEDGAIPYFQVDYSDLRALKNAQSVRKLPIHPELIRLGFLEYIAAMRQLGHALLFPEMHSPRQSSFAKTFYTSVFRHWRSWAFPNGTEWSHVARGATKDKDVHSFRGVASSLMKGKIPDSVRFDILGHEGENTTQSVYDEEAELGEKLKGLVLISPLTAHLAPFPLNLRPTERQKFGAKKGRPRKS